MILVFNVLGVVPVGQSQASGSVPVFAQDSLGDRIVICTATGMVVMDRNGTVIPPETGQVSHAAQCVFCLPLMQGGAQVPAMVQLGIVSHVITKDKVLFGAPLIARLPRLDGTASPRAPPLA